MVTFSVLWQLHSIFVRGDWLLGGDKREDAPVPGPSKFHEKQVVATHQKGGTVEPTGTIPIFSPRNDPQNSLPERMAQKSELFLGH